MQKEFDTWNTLKKKIHKREGHERYFHDREVWWCSLGINIGVEQDGTNNYFVRPVVILRRYSKDMALIAPLTRTKKDSRFYHVLGTHPLVGSRVVLSQLRTISSRRLRKRMARIPEKEFTVLQKKIVALNFKSTEEEK